MLEFQTPLCRLLLGQSHRKTAGPRPTTHDSFLSHMGQKTVMEPTARSHVNFSAQKVSGCLFRVFPFSLINIENLIAKIANPKTRRGWLSWRARLWPGRSPPRF